MKTLVSHPLVIASLAIGLVNGRASAQSFWINEFHYDNAGTDVGEFVEVVAPANFTDLASVRLTLYNGGDGTPYGSSHLLSSFTPGATESDYRFYSKSISGLQNGAPDGLALDVGGTVRHFVSYEGHFLAQAGPASGLTSDDVGFTETDATGAGSSIGLTGTGRDYSEFTWNTSASVSRGSPNTGQSVSAVPEPQEYALAAGFGMAAYAFWRRRRIAPPTGTSTPRNISSSLEA